MRNSTVTSVAVLPVEGDPEMGARLATVLQQETTLRVESPATVEAGVSETDPRSTQADDADRSALAKEITQGNHARHGRRYRSRQPCCRFAVSSQRLGMESRGLMMPLSVPGESRWTPALEGRTTLYAGQRRNPAGGASVQVDLAHHLMQHVKKLRLDELGYLPKRIS